MGPFVYAAFLASQIFYVLWLLTSVYGCLYLTIVYGLVLSSFRLLRGESGMNYGNRTCHLNRNIMSAWLGMLEEVQFRHGTSSAPYDSMVSKCLNISQLMKQLQLLAQVDHIGSKLQWISIRYQIMKQSGKKSSPNTTTYDMWETELLYMCSITSPRSRCTYWPSDPGDEMNRSRTLLSAGLRFMLTQHHFSTLRTKKIQLFYNQQSFNLLWWVSSTDIWKSISN